MEKCVDQCEIYPHDIDINFCTIQILSIKLDYTISYIDSKLSHVILKFKFTLDISCGNIVRFKFNYIFVKMNKLDKWNRLRVRLTIVLE